MRETVQTWSRTGQQAVVLVAIQLGLGVGRLEQGGERGVGAGRQERRALELWEITCKWLFLNRSVLDSKKFNTKKDFFNLLSALF